MRPPLARRSWNRALIRSTSGTRSLADLVHDLVAEALEQAHHRLRLAEQAPLLGRPSAAPASGSPSDSPRSVAPSAAHGRRDPARRASSPNSASWRSRRDARYGRSQGWASNSKAWVVSWSAIQVRNGASGTPSALAAGGCSPRRTAAGRAPARPTAARGRTGRAPAGPGSRAGSPSWRVVTQRLASAIDAGAEIRRPAGRLVEQVGLELADERARTSPVFARTQPARSTTRERSTTPGQLRAERRGQRRHDPRHRRGVGGLGARAARPRSSAPGARASRAIAIRSTVGQSTRPRRAAPLGAPADDGRRGRERGPDEEPGLPDAVVAPGRADGSRRRPSVIGPATREVDRARRPGRSVPNSRSPAGACVRTSLRGRRSSAGTSCRGARRGRRRASGRLDAVDLEQLGQRRRGRRRRVDDRDAGRPTTASMSGRSSG